VSVLILSHNGACVEALLKLEMCAREFMPTGMVDPVVSITKMFSTTLLVPARTRTEPHNAGTKIIDKISLYIYIYI
jgi:hypothetical protein